MPSISSGFWVARTKNGGSSGKRCRATVTWCSCIASSRLDWVFGVARLISSARTRFAKIGPGWKRKTRLPPSSMRMFVPVMSAGIRSGVNWIRLNVQSMTSAIVRTSIVLPRPGTPSSRTWLFARRPVSVWRTRSLLADDDPADLGLDRPGALGEGLGGERVRTGLVGRGCGSFIGSSGGECAAVAHLLGSSELK